MKIHAALLLLLAFLAPVLSRAEETKSTPPVALATPPPKPARYVRGPENNALQVPRMQYTGPHGEKLELTGVIHIGDRAWYERLNEHFRSFDAVLFEMVGNQDKVDILQKKAPKPPVDEKKEEEKQEDPLRAMYKLLSRDILKMPFQPEVIDYSPANFIHADVSEDELDAMFKEKGLSKAKIFGDGTGILQLRLALGLVKLMTSPDDPHAMKRLFAPVFGSLGSGFGGQKAVEEIIIDRRNDKALAVLDREVAAGKKNLSLFYGSGHFADFDRKLTAKGWTKTGESWDDAWLFPSNDSKPATPPVKEKAEAK